MNRERQTVFITGEPGIGKTALADEFQRQAGDVHGVRIVYGQCIEGYGGKEAYYPVLLQPALTELRLARGDLREAREAEQFLNVPQATAERTWQALAWEANARVAMAEANPVRAQDCVAKGLSAIEGWSLENARTRRKQKGE